MTFMKKVSYANNDRVLYKQELYMYIYMYISRYGLCYVLSRSPLQHKKFSLFLFNAFKVILCPFFSYIWLTKA